MLTPVSGRNLAIVVAIAVCAASEARPQAVGVDPTAAQVAQSLRTNGHSAGARAVLTQARGPRSPTQLNEMADTLVSIAATFKAPGARGVSTRLAALSALMFAGRGDTGIDDGSGGVPYTGAADRIKRLAEIAQAEGTRAAAVHAPIQLPDSVRYFPFLATIATAARDEVAQTAVTLLVNDLGPSGKAVARELFAKGLVTQWSAKNTLEGAAATFGWRRP